MRPNHDSTLGRDLAPRWAEASAPRNLLRRIVPSLLLINTGVAGEWRVAEADETDAIADPHSPLGTLLRGHCAMMAIPYTSNN
ncbi:MAG TPA: hypothetical protein VFR15_16980 [Chloroflexia bacterium]|nr:hypothetical protein [Chloroflexia bacterium]